MDRRVPATVLLLEGRDEARAAQSEALRAAGLHVTEAHTSEQVQDALEAINPSIIVVSFDAQTRDDRLSLCRAVKADPRTRRIPIVLTTSDMTSDDVGLATDPGVLVLTLAFSDGAKLAAAINGVLAAQRAEPLRTSLRRRREVKRSA